MRYYTAARHCPCNNICVQCDGIVVGELAIVQRLTRRHTLYLDGKLFRVHGGAHAYALDAQSGRILWDVSFKVSDGEGAPMAPIAWNGLVFVGNSGGDNMGVQGHVHALDVNTGRKVWRFDVVPDTGAARATWPTGPNATPPTGGGMWSSFTLDPAAGILYVPAGNPAPDYLTNMAAPESDKQSDDLSVALIRRSELDHV